MKITATRDKIIGLNGVLKKMADVKDTKFAYMVMKNTLTIDAEIEILKKMVEIPADVQEKLNEFETKRMEFVKQYANKDDKGELIIVNNNYDVTEENLALFNVEFDKLTEEYKEFLTAKTDNDVKIAELLAEEIDIELRSISKDKLDFIIDFDDGCPKDLTAKQLDLIRMLEE